MSRLKLDSSSFLMSSLTSLSFQFSVAPVSRQLKESLLRDSFCFISWSIIKLNMASIRNRHNRLSASVIISRKNPLLRPKHSASQTQGMIDFTSAALTEMPSHKVRPKTSEQADYNR